jgi:translation initiation factor IF-1
MSTTDLMDPIEGEVLKLLPGGPCLVQFANGHTATCHPTGKMRIAKVRLLPGDKVLAQLSPYDLTKGRITWRVR